MAKFKSTTLLSTLVGAALLSQPVMADPDLQKEIDALKKQNQTIMERMNATMDMMESKQPASHGHGSGKGKTTVGGYGELHYSNQANSIADQPAKKEIDLHRFILFLGHEFSKDIRFWSEMEVEHATADPNGGEVAMEQAYLEFDLSDKLQSRAGILLVPVGFINETHEPPVFYGVERNNVEKYIIPTTWREGGVSINGKAGDFKYDLVVHSGLQISSGDNYAVRKGRKGVREAPANAPAVTARVKWNVTPGLELGAALQNQSDMGQGMDASVGAGTLTEAHAVWQVNKFTLKALYASWNITGSGAASVGADKQTGWYIEPSYKLTPKMGVFARYSTWDNRAGDNADSAYTQSDIGVNYWPHEDVVVKMDFQTQTAPAGKSAYNGINLGIGYMF